MVSRGRWGIRRGSHQLAMFLTGMFLASCVGCSSDPYLVRLADWRQHAPSEDGGNETKGSPLASQIAELRFYEWEQAKRCDEAWARAFMEEEDSETGSTNRVENTNLLLRRKLAGFEKSISNPGGFPADAVEMGLDAEISLFRYDLRRHHADLTAAYRACVGEGSSTSSITLAEAKASILEAALMIMHGLEDVAAFCLRHHSVGGELVVLDYCRRYEWWSDVYAYVPRDLLVASPGELPTDMHSSLSEEIRNQDGPPFLLWSYWPTYPLDFGGSDVSWAHEEPRTVLWGMVAD